MVALPGPEAPGPEGGENPATLINPPNIFFQQTKKYTCLNLIRDLQFRGLPSGKDPGDLGDQAARSRKRIAAETLEDLEEKASKERLTDILAKMS